MVELVLLRSKGEIPICPTKPLTLISKLFGENKLLQEKNAEAQRSTEVILVTTIKSFNGVIAIQKVYKIFII